MLTHGRFRKKLPSSRTWFGVSDWPNSDIVAFSTTSSARSRIDCGTVRPSVFAVFRLSTRPKPMTSGAKSDGRFGKQDFVYLATEDVYRCPAGEKLTYRYTSEEDGKALRRYWATACSNCPIKARCTTGPQRRIARWEHEHVLEAVQQRLDNNPQAMRTRRETAEHPFGTLKMRMGATHFLMKTLPHVATEMALHVLAYNLTRIMNIVGIQPLIAAIRA
jgi:hypothetical protein